MRNARASQRVKRSYNKGATPSRMLVRPPFSRHLSFHSRRNIIDWEVSYVQVYQSSS